MMQRSHLPSIALALLLSCAGTNLTSAQEPASPAATAKPPAVEDRSLTLEEADGMKYPPLDRPWKGKDYEAATEILSRLGTLDAARLPRTESSRSGELFARLTTTAHFASFNDASVEVKTRVPDALEQLQSLNRLGVIYLSAADRKLVGSKEYLEIYGAFVHAARGVLLALDQYEASLDEKDPTSAIRKQGLVKLKDVIGDMSSSVLGAIGNEMLPTDERRRLIESVQVALPEVMNKLPEARRQALVLRLKFIAVNSEPEELRPALQKLVAEINKAAATANP